MSHNEEMMPVELHVLAADSFFVSDENRFLYFLVE